MPVALDAPAPQCSLLKIGVLLGSLHGLWSRRMAADLPHRSAILGTAQISCVLATYPYGDHNDLPQESKKALQNPRTGLSKLHSAPGERRLFLQHAFAC